VLRIVLAFAIDRDYRRDNPAKEIKRLPTGDGHATWPDWAIDRFLASAPPMMGLALKLGLYTGQREGDVLAMSWHDYDREHIDGAHIDVVQSKTGTKLWIPVHTLLCEALDSQERVSPIMLTTDTGRPFRGSNFRHHFGNAMKAAGIEGLSYHGLRYAATARLFEAGCNPKEVAAITGHRSLAMLDKYGREADQKRLARAAIVRLEQNAHRT
jgi:integrase